MSKPTRVPPWGPPLSLVAIVPLIWLASFSPVGLDPFRVTAQALLLIMLVRAFCYWTPMVRWFAAMPMVHRIVFMALIWAMAAGHYTFNKATFYPYIAWEIFPYVNEKQPEVPEFIGTTQSGHKVRLLVEQLFPSIVQFYPPTDPAQLEHLVAAMAKVYNEHHADDVVEHVDLMLITVDLHPPAGQSRAEPSCEFL